jgi:glutamine amidotransferase
MSSIKIGIIDYGVGNTLSVANALTYLKYKVNISSEQRLLSQSDVLILPGVGAFETAISNLRRSGLKDFLNEEVLIKQKPIMGICLGMQLMATRSFENGKHLGLNWIPGEVVKIQPVKNYPVPHVGWNTIETIYKLPAFRRLNECSHFYFDHSFYFQPDDKSHIAALVDYGASITAAIQKDHILGVQFHPEKSQIYGLKLLKDFISISELYA